MAPYLEVLCLAILEWHKLIDHSGAATAEDLERFVRLLFSLLSEKLSGRNSNTQDIDHFVVVTSLRSPAFWELPELRRMHFPLFW